jgi:AcrR family transcriptional regulator
MATRARMSRDERKAATRTELLDAARRVFVERGYHGASLDLVAREAGYTKGAVYSAFGSKGQMFLAVYEHEIEGRIAAFEASASDPEGGARSWLERVRTERGWTLALLEFRLHAARDPQLNAAYAERHQRYLDAVTAITGTNAAKIIALGNGFALEALALPGEDIEQLFVEAVREVMG